MNNKRYKRSTTHNTIVYIDPCRAVIIQNQRINELLKKSTEFNGRGEN